MEIDRAAPKLRRRNENALYNAKTNRPVTLAPIDRYLTTPWTIAHAGYWIMRGDIFAARWQKSDTTFSASIISDTFSRYFRARCGTSSYPMLFSIFSSLACTNINTVLHMCYYSMD